MINTAPDFSTPAAPGLLASVRDQNEAAIALQAGVHILDLKNPSRGALGALDKQTIIAIRKQAAGRCPVSATIGDLPPHAQDIARQTHEWADIGIDFVKVGFLMAAILNRALAH